MSLGATQHQDVLKSQVQAQRDRYVTIMRDLLAKSADGENTLQQAIAQYLSQLGYQIESIASKPNRFVLNDDFAPSQSTDDAERISVVGMKAGEGEGRRLLVFAHPDSEPIADTEAWQHDPFAGEIDNSHMYGWGIADDLSGVVAIICALDAVQTAGLRLSGQVICASTVSKGRAQGIYAVLEQDYDADAAIYLHPAESGAGLGDIKARTSGMLRFRITVKGQPPDTNEPTHTPFYHRAINPIDKAWLIYQALNELAEQRAQDVHHPAFEAIGRSTNLHIAHIQAGDESYPSRVPAIAVMSGTVTFPPNEALEDVQHQIESVVQQASKGDSWLKDNPAQLDWLMGTSGVEISEDSAIYQTVSKAIHHVTGTLPGVQSLHSGSEIRAPMHFKSIPTLGFGPLAGDLTQAGGTDEWVDVEDFMRMVEVVANIMVDWCGVKA